MLLGTEVLVKKPKISVREVEDAGIIYDENTGDLHLFNSSSLFIWNLLDGSENLYGIAEKLAEHCVHQPHR